MVVVCAHSEGEYTHRAGCGGGEQGAAAGAAREPVMGWRGTRRMWVCAQWWAAVCVREQRVCESGPFESSKKQSVVAAAAKSAWVGVLVHTCTRVCV